MNKKVIIIVVIIECIAAILLVSFWGKMVESRNTVIVPTEVYFTDEDGNRIDDNARIEIELSDSNRDYQLYWKVLPNNATNKEVEFLCERDDAVAISETGRVTFFTDATVQVIVRTMDGEQDATIILSPNRN